MRSISRNQIYFNLVILILFLFVVLALNVANAEEGAEKAPASGEATAEGAAEGEGSAPASAPPSANNSDFAEYNKKINKMSQLSGKVEEGQKKIQQLIVQKRMGLRKIKGEKGDEQDVLELINSTHKEFLDNRDKYNSELRDVTYRFPSRGQEIQRKYRPYRPKTVEQIEKELGLDGQLSDLKNKVQEKYHVFNPKKEVVVPEPLPESRQPASEPSSERLRLVK